MRYYWTAAAAFVLGVAGAAPGWAQTEDWSGFSAAVLGGAQETNDQGGERLIFDRDFDGDFDDQVVTVAGSNAFSPGFCGGAANGATPSAGCRGQESYGEGVLRGGYDYQFGSFVLGGLVEATGTRLRDRVTGFSTTPASYTFQRNLQGTLAARARVGYAYGPALAYATGGYAIGRIDNRFRTTNMTNGFTTADDDESDADGWQAGGGLEYRLAPRLSIIGEYLYTSLDVDDPFTVRAGLGAAAATNPFVLPPNTAGTDIRRSNDEFRYQSLRVGMAFRF